MASPNQQPGEGAGKAPQEQPQPAPQAGAAGNEPQEKVQPIEESETWAEQSEKVLFGTSKGLSGEALKKFNLLQTYPAMSNEREYIKSMLRGFARRVFETFAARLEQGEQVRQETRRKLEVFRRESAQMLEAMGKLIRTKGGFPEVTEEAEVLAMHAFVDSLRNIDTVDAAVDVFDRDQGFLRMMAEVNGIPAPMVEGASDSNLDLSGQKLLDPDNPVAYKQNLIALKMFIRDTQRDENDAGRDAARKTLETAIWIEIVRKMPDAQRIDLLKSFYNDGEKGAKEAEVFVETCVRAGAFSDQDAVKLLQDPVLTKGVRGITATPGPEYTERLEKARDVFIKQQEAIAGAVDYLSRTRHGNPIREGFTYSNAVWNYVVFNAGFVGGIGTIFMEYGGRLRGQKTWAGRAEAIGEATLALAQNPVFYLNAALVGASIEGMSGGLGKGAVTRSLLYSPSEDQKKHEREKKTVSEIGGVLGSRPEMSDFIYANYDYMLSQARSNDAFGHGFKLLPVDLKIPDRDLSAWHFPADDAGRLEALKAINFVLAKLAKDLKLESQEAVGACFETKGFAYDRNIYPERQAALATLRGQFEEYPGMAGFMARNYDKLQAFLGRGKEISLADFEPGIRYEFDKLCVQWKCDTEAKKEEAMAQTFRILGILNEDFQIANSVQVKAFFADFELIPKTPLV